MARESPLWSVSLSSHDLGALTDAEFAAEKAGLVQDS
jgi:hypothetical protein